MKHTKTVLFHVITPLSLGGIIYISFRSTTLKMFDWLGIIGISNCIYSIRCFFQPIKKFLPQWCYYSLPDALWVYSFSSIYLIMWKDQFKNGKYWLIIPLTLGCLVEILQGLQLFKGTFDVIDLILCLMAFLLSISILKPTKHNLHEEELSQNY